MLLCAFYQYGFLLLITEAFGKDCNSIFEIIDIFVETGSRLNRHMDYLNGRKKGYDYLTVYSWVGNYGGRTWRLTTIMAMRSYVDASMEELRKLGGTWTILEGNNPMKTT